MRKIFLVQLENGSFCFSGAPGDADGIRRKRTKPNIQLPEPKTAPDDNGQLDTMLPPAA